MPQFKTNRFNCKTEIRKLDRIKQKTHVNLKRTIESLHIRTPIIKNDTNEGKNQSLTINLAILIFGFDFFFLYST